MYNDFLKWAEAQGLDFPCTASQFAARVAAFLGDRWNAVDFGALMDQGCGPNWRD